MLRVQKRGEHVNDKTFSCLSHPKCGRDGRGNKRGIDERRQVNKAHAIREVSLQISGNLKSQAGLAHSPGTAQRYQRHLVALEKLLESSALFLTSNQRRAWQTERWLWDRQRRHWPRRASRGFVRGLEKCLSLRPRKLQRPEQHGERVRMRTLMASSLELTDGPGAQSRAFGQCFLGQVGSEPMSEQQIGEGKGVARVE